MTMPSRDANGRRLSGYAQRRQATERGEQFNATLADLKADRKMPDTLTGQIEERISILRDLLDVARADGHVSTAAKIVGQLGAAQRELEIELRRGDPLRDW